MRRTVAIAFATALIVPAAAIPVVLARPAAESVQPVDRVHAFSCYLDRVDPNSSLHFATDPGLISLDLRRYVSNPRSVGLRTVLRVYRDAGTCCGGEPVERELVEEFISDPILVPGGALLDDTIPLVVAVPPGRYLAQAMLESDFGFHGRDWKPAAGDFLRVVVVE